MITYIVVMRDRLVNKSERTVQRGFGFDLKISDIIKKEFLSKMPSPAEALLQEGGNWFHQQLNF